MKRSKPKQASADGKQPVKLNNKFVEALAASEMWWDDDPKAMGFGVRCYAGGGKSFFIDYRLDGRQRRFTIGPFPRWSADAARSGRRNSQADRPGPRPGRSEAGAPRGADRPRPDRPLHRRPPSEEGEREDPRRRREEDARGDRQAPRQAHQGHRCSRRRRRGDAPQDQRIDRPGRKPRRVRANRILTVASKMFSLSLRSRDGENAPWRNAVLGNPCKGIERNHEEGRERFFSQAELAAISDALNEYPGVAADCVRLIMLTGCRPAEAMGAEWTEFDNEPGFWIKPSAHTKQRKVHRLPLSPAAIELIERLRKKRFGKWVFPGDIKGKHLAALWHVWHFVRKRTGLGQDARVYDLRHTFASIGAGGGLSLPIIGRLLGHTQSRTTEKYAHFADDPVREAATKITTVIAGAGKPAAEIVPLRGRRS